MPTKNKPLVEKAVTETLANVQKDVCSDIMRTGDVIKSVVMSTVISNFSNKVDRNVLVDIQRQVESDITAQTNSLVERVIRTTSKND